MLGLINDGWALYDPPKGKVAGSNPAWDTISRISLYSRIAIEAHGHNWVMRRSSSSKSAMPSTRVVFKPRK